MLHFTALEDVLESDAVDAEYDLFQAAPDEVDAARATVLRTLFWQIKTAPRSHMDGRVVHVPWPVCPAEAEMFPF